MRKFLRDFWCDWTHGGGKIFRDSVGRLNWQCCKCGRWSDSPVPLKEESAAIGRAIKKAGQSRRQGNQEGRG